MVPPSFSPFPFQIVSGASGSNPDLLTSCVFAPSQGLEQKLKCLKLMDYRASAQPWGFETKKNGYSKSEQMLFPKELYNPKEHGSALES